MATYSKIKPFNPASDNWTIYEDKLELYLAANSDADSEADDMKKGAILLAVCDDQAFKLRCKLDADDVTYDSLIALLRDHYSSKESTILYRFRCFNSRSRKQEETVAEYIAAP